MQMCMTLLRPHPHPHPLWRFPAHRLQFLMEIPSRWFLPSAQPLWWSITGTCWIEEIHVFRHIDPRVFSHTHPVNCTDLWQVATFSSLKSQESGSPMFKKKKKKDKCWLIQRNHYLENDSKESSPRLFSSKEWTWAASNCCNFSFPAEERGYRKWALLRGAAHSDTLSTSMCDFYPILELPSRLWPNPIPGGPPWKVHSCHPHSAGCIHL